MRTKRIGLWIAIGFLVAVVAIVLDPTKTVLGKLRGEAFFQSRPTSYWAGALRADPAKQADAQARLEQGGGEAVPVLVGLLRDYSARDDAELRWKAAEILAKLGPDANESGSALVAALRDPDPHVQAVCASALAKVGVPADIAVPLLGELLKSGDAVVVARALSQYKAAASPALPALVELLQDESRSVEARWNAARTIGKIGPEAVSAVPALMKFLKDKDGTLREHCAEAIGDIGPGVGPEAITALIPVLSDPVTRVRRDAVRSLGYIGPAAREAVPEIKKLVEDKEEMVREAARAALKKVAPEE